ncbi:ATPase [Vibrio parahaemolyticus]|uniref:AAA family ATPase n=1 Tax=Vibrio parahaemolyticus TaxID=670 RepID=UPI001122099E|nr:AAA family ATPase [Vibrio parahaemolyticus]TOH59279.1 ATPase [Vibrio parahaemolyticus]
MTREIKYDKSIRALKNNSRKNNFYSSFQLYDYYQSGRYVEPNEKEAELYLKKSYDIFKNQKIKLEKIDIFNFRVFNKIKIDDFDDNINIFIGNNGAGKTSFLDAIDLSLSWFSNSINKSGGSGDYIEEEDINNYSQEPYSSVALTIRFNRHLSSEIELHKSKSGNVKLKNKLNELRLVGSFYKTANEFNEQFNMPLLAYYNVMRSYDVNPKDLRSLDSLNESTVIDKFDAYEKSLSGKTDFSSFVKWYWKSDHIISRRDSAKNKQKVLEDIGLTNELLIELEKLSSSDKQAKSTLEKLRTIIGDVDDSFVSNDTDNLEKKRKIINEVVSIFMGGYSDIEVQLEPTIDLLIKKNGRKISVMKLSQGEKTLLALVLDIARRLIILNPSLSNPLHGNGIVLIDEFDLHLHPKWQMSIANNLKKTFPNCQFFLTTHSPLVISELAPKHVFIFNEDIDSGNVTLTRPNQTYGLTTIQILNELMNDDSSIQFGRAQRVEEYLDEIFLLIDKEDRNSLHLAQRKIADLEHEIHGDIPDLIKAKAQIELQLEWLEDEED